MELKGKIAIVTGAASGIGRGIANTLAEAGSITIFADRDHAATVESSERSFPMVLDVTDDASVKALVADVCGRHGGIDILVNAAGVFSPEGLAGTTPADMRRVFEVNLFGLTELMRLVAADMIDRRRPGRIINIASIVGRQGQRLGLAYAASKAAVISVTQSAALELAAHDVAVNAIAPGYVKTAMWEDIRARVGGGHPQFDEQVASSVPMGRLATPEDIAGAALFLAGSASAFITGQTLNVDGGAFPC